MLWLLACADCPSFDQIEIEDPWGYLEAGQEEEIWTAIHDFAAWTGRDGVCVGTIEVWRDATGDPAGRFSDWQDRISVEVGVEGDETRRIVQHELCHALDAQEGISEAHPELFPFESVPESELRRTERLRRREAFAEACEDVPTDFSLLEAAWTACGGGPGSYATRYFLRNHVFPGYPAMEVAIAPLELHWKEQARRGLSPLVGGIYDAELVGDDLVVLAEYYSWFDERYESAAIRLPGDPSTPASGGIFEHGPWTLAVAPDGTTYLAIGAEQAPDRIEGGLYRLSEDGTLSPVPGGPVLDSVEGMAIDDEALWISGEAYLTPAVCGLEPDSGAYCGENRVLSWDPATGKVDEYETARAIVTPTGVELTDYETWDIPALGVSWLRADLAWGGWYLTEQLRVFQVATGGVATLDVATGEWAVAGCGGIWPTEEETTRGLRMAPDGRAALLDVSEPFTIAYSLLTTTASP